MAVKEEILQILESNRGKPLSGEMLAAQFSVSRAAVWKAMQALKAEGYPIHAVSNRGYWLDARSDILSAEGIKAFLPEECREQPVLVFPVVDSTNTRGKQLAGEGASHGTAVLANAQTEGRGRRGRSFFSPADTGLYLSLILRPRQRIEDALLITVAMAVAACQAIEALSEARPQIKWVNDIYLQDKKIGGILTEAVSDFESGMVESLVVGIGLNVSTPESRFPEALRAAAGSFFPEGITRNQLAAEVICRLMQWQKNLADPRLMQEYRARFLLFGQTVSYEMNGVVRYGTVQDVNDRGNLVLRDADGAVVVLQSGEVTVRRTDRAVQNHNKQNQEE